MLLAAGQDHFHHVRDFPYFELPLHLGEAIDSHGHTVYGIQLPEVAGFQITKFMVLQVIAGLLTLLIFKGLSRRVRGGEPTQGRFWNFWESIALYIRDEVVRPTVGDGHHHHDDGHGDSGHDESHAVKSSHAGHYADRFLPFIWTCFFYILFCNLLGAVPMLGSPTGSLSVTGVLAVSVFVFNLIQGTKQFGFVGFWKNQCPDLGLDGLMGVVIGLGVWCIEVVGLFIKHGVLAVRLFANVMGGHTVIGVILGFIAADGVAGTMLQGLVIPASIGGQIFIGLLELFVAFLQAYVFAYLSTIFLSASLHAH
ncbi:MAG: F0F1 ATP synthase subunit A [Rhodopirellula sp.]|nr:F0F1 ATP synthase subunit A [Rhodopirellula sp.]